MHDKTLWCTPDVIERKTRNQGERPLSRRIQDRNVVGIHNLNFLDDIRVWPVRTKQFNLVARCKVFKAAKETIPMACNPKVAYLPHLRGSKNAADAAVQGQVIRVVIQWHFEPNLGNP